MIDRKAIWFAITATAAMIAAAIWRISLSTDWHRIPLDGPGSAHTLNSLLLFVHPLTLMVVTAGLYARKWILSGSDDAVQPWRRHGTLFVIGLCAVVGLMQAFTILRSLGFGLALDRVTVVRIFFGAMGVLLIVFGNVMPKLPWLAARFRILRLDPWQQKRHLRFTGRLMVAMGSYFAALAIGLPLVKLLPRVIALPMVMMPGLMVTAASLWNRAKLMREPAQLT